MHDKSSNAIPTAEWMRLPVKGRDPVFGLTRPFYYDQIKAGTIRSSCIRRPGCLTGVRLINVASVRRLIEANADVDATTKAG